jgi:hypothetical protein
MWQNLPTIGKLFRKDYSENSLKAKKRKKPAE